MSLMNITADTLTRDLGKEIPPVYVIVAKHSVLGMDTESIAELLGCDPVDVTQVESDPVYKEVRIFIGAAHMTAGVDQTLGIDSLEEMAIEQLRKRVPYEKDADFLLRLFAVTNKAVRRQAPTKNVLDPSQRNGRTALTLTTRLVEKLNGSGRTRELIEERELSISDGSMSNPSFDEVDKFLHVSRATLPRHVEIQAHTAEPSFEELDQAMKEKGF